MKKLIATIWAVVFAGAILLAATACGDNLQRVIELSEQYRQTHGREVCWDAAVGFWQVLDDNSIDSILVVRKSEIDNWGETSTVLSHVWLIVGDDIPVEYARVVAPEDNQYQALLEYDESYPNPDALKAAYPLLFKE